MILLFENGRNRKLRGIFILSFALLSLYGTREIVSAEREIFDYHSTLEAELRKHINDSIQRTTNNYQLSTNTGDSITPAAGASPLLPPISIMLVAPSRSGLTGCAPNLPLVASLLRYGDLEHPDEGWQCPVYFESGSTADYEHPAGATREDNQIGQSGFLSNINVRKINDHQIELTGSEGVVFVPKPAGKFSAAYRFTRHRSGVNVIAKELWQLKPSAARVCLLTFPRELIHSNAVIFYPEKGKLKSAPIKEFLGGK
jgi:hypothetical protein